MKCSIASSVLDVDRNGGVENVGRGAAIRASCSNEVSEEGHIMNTIPEGQLILR